MRIALRWTRLSYRMSRERSVLAMIIVICLAVFLFPE